eukprot:scaffold4941_cov179-Ochromonas_danica.AAC.9
MAAPICSDGSFFDEKQFLSPTAEQHSSIQSVIYQFKGQNGRAGNGIVVDMLANRGCFSRWI